MEAHTSTSLGPGTTSYTALIPLKKLAPGHSVTVHVTAVTGPAGPAARVYYTHMAGTSTNSCVHPAVVMTTTVALIGAKTPSRTVMTRGGLSSPKMFTSRVTGPTPSPMAGGAIGAASLNVGTDHISYDIHHAAVYPYHASLSGVAPVTPVGPHHRPEKTRGAKHNEPSGVVYPRTTPTGANSTPPL